MIFTSDNASGVAPEILSAVAAADPGYAGSYGADPVTAEVEARVREIFEAPQARVFLVATGTAANALSLACLCPPWGAIYCHDQAHIEADECGAPEFYSGGAKLVLIDGDRAKMTAEGLGTALGAAGTGFVHSVQPGAVSLTQVTELGAAYTVAEVAAIAGAARTHGLPVHMDGTRFANAVARLGCSPADLTWRAGVDILCLGATKNGAMAAEAVILFDPDRSWEFELRRKRGGHLFSKMRFVAAQMNAYLTDDLWLRMAAHANAMADRLAAGINQTAGCRVPHDVDANMLFPEITLGQFRRLQEAGAGFYPWPMHQDLDAPDEATVSIRLVTSFRTTDDDIDGFLTHLRT